ncbi:MAG: chorismate-binding protein [Aquirufa sp.]
MREPFDGGDYTPEMKQELAWEEGITKGAAVAAWRLPHGEEAFLLQDFSGGSILDEGWNLADLAAGFLAAPFIGLPYFLQADSVTSFPLTATKRVVHFVAPTENTAKKAEFMSWVSEAITAIKQGPLQKVVLSRTDEQDLPADFKVMTALEELGAAYPNAFVCALSIPALSGVWMCATPEILVEQNAAGIFRTISLAGTQSGVDADGFAISPSQARWSQKEIEEQAFVSRYIIECFKKIRLREYTEIGPKTISTGNLLHLKTEYIVDTKAMDFPQLPGLMLGLLHPTSAVCGTPKQEAVDFISNTESHDRSMYSGYVGPVNLGNATHLFVNLRTVEIRGTKAVFYAGCGITEDSDPAKEWQETQMKCQTLQRVLMQ